MTRPARAVDGRPAVHGCLRQRLVPGAGSAGPSRRGDPRRMSRLRLGEPAKRKRARWPSRFVTLDGQRRRTRSSSRSPARRCCGAARTTRLTGAEGGCAQGTCGACVVTRRRRARSLLPDSGRDHQRRDRAERSRACATAASCTPLQARLRRGLRHPMRLLHARHDHGGEGAAGGQSEPDAATTWSEAISGNVCRCTGYEPIIHAILAAADAAARRRSRQPPAEEERAMAQHGAKSTRAISPTSARPTLKVIGTAAPRADALGHVTGQTRLLRRRPLSVACCT